VHIATYDVFADKPFAGNPAAVVRPGTRRLSDRQLITLAAELALPETALSCSIGDTLTLRFATADRVVSRCGHASLAAIADHVLFGTDGNKQAEWMGRYRVDGALAEWRVYHKHSRASGSRQNSLQVSLCWPDRPSQIAILPASQVYASIGLAPSHGVPELPACIYHSGNRNALVSVQTVSQLNSATPNWTKLKALFHEHNLTDLHIYCITKKSRTVLNLRCRNVFPYGVLEEAATGTASIALAGMLTDYVFSINGADEVDFIFDQGKGERRGKLAVKWSTGTGRDVAIWLSGKVFPITKGDLVRFPS
jgi:PhzF family phenazine biosynthesis protein